MQLKTIDIINFRGFDHLKVEDFGQLNVIVGKNNVGKTAFLEAIALATGGSERDVLLNLNRVREHNQLTLSSFSAFFYNLTFANTPIIESEWNLDTEQKHTRLLKIRGLESQNYDFDGSLNPVAGVTTFGSVTVTPVDSKVNRIEVETKADDGYVTISLQYSSRGNEGKLQVQGRRELTEAVIFLPSTTTEEAIERIAFLKENRLERPLVAVLQRIDKRIKNVEVIGNQILLDVEGVEKFVPLWVQGDGLKKVISIMASVIGTDASTLVLVDEIENGLHYSAHVELWKALIQTLQLTRAQLFTTTHSEETLKYLYQALDEFPDFKDQVRCFDIANTKLKGFQAYKYTYEGLAGAIEKEIEIRL